MRLRQVLASFRMSIGYFPLGEAVLQCSSHCMSLMQVAEKVGAHVTEVKNVIIWGNHSSSQFPDVAHGTVGGKPIKEAIKDDEWLKGDFVSTVQQRGAAIIKVLPINHSITHCI